MDGEELTEQETALYDRQIRVWGVDAQRRLSKAHILVSGMKGTVVEFCKNIVLAGVGSLTLVDSREVTEEALSANFLIPPDENVYSGKTLAELCCDSLKDFNPMVRVSVEKGDISSFGGDFYDRFDVVVISSCSFATKHLRPGSSGKGFGWVYGRKFTYLLEHYCIGDVLKGLPVIERFEEAEGRNPGEISIADLPGVLKLKKELCEAQYYLVQSQSFNESHVPDALLERLVSDTSEFPPVCAILGGILGQEVIKAISGKGDPLKNFFFFDAIDGKGIIEDISNPNPGS
uniref:THIF-type NAD/FAD binding fold domain-containing protein n=1 Tax=Vitis vinifera TaxID=29760 RepID=A5BME4_VITVI|nr:hypothetical protein VITISV_022139 [Vitis vinifera]